MPKDNADKSVDGQQKSDGNPGDGAIEWTGEPLPADVIAAAAASAAAMASGGTAGRSPRPQSTLPKDPAAAPSIWARSDEPGAPDPAESPAAPDVVTSEVVAPAVVATPAPTPTAAPTPTPTTAPVGDLGSDIHPDDEPLTYVRKLGSTPVGGSRPWAVSTTDWVDRPGPNSHRRLIMLAGAGFVVVALVASAFAGLGGGGGAATPKTTPPEVGLATPSVEASASTAASESASASTAATQTASATDTPTITPTSPPGPVTAATALAADRGALLFTDSFRNPKSGWSTPSKNSAVTTYSYGSAGYLIGSRTGMLEHMAYAPYHTTKQQLSMSVTASQAGAPKGAGFGVTCRRGTAAAQTSYTLVVMNTGSYYIERYDGVPSGSSSPKTLKRGTSSVAPGSTPITIVGMCATMGGGSTRLALFVDGQKIADLTDTVKLVSAGWTGGIDMQSGKTTSVLTVTSWQERDLSN